MYDGERSIRKDIPIKVDEAKHNALLRVSAETGRHITKLGEEAMDLFLVDYARKMGMGSVDPEIRVQAMEIEARSREKTIETLRYLAAIQIRKPSTEGMEKLISLCESIEVELDEIMRDIKDSEYVLAYMEIKNRPLNKAELWLLEHMTPGREYIVNDLVAEAARDGIKKLVLENARSSLNIKTSHRKGNGNRWTWMLPEMLYQNEDDNTEKDASTLQREEW